MLPIKYQLLQKKKKNGKPTYHYTSHMRQLTNNSRIIERKQVMNFMGHIWSVL